MKSVYLLDGRNIIISKLGKDDYYMTDSTYGFVGEINHGEMIEKTQQDKIFEQGFTTKKDGWGIGLSVCKKFVGSQFGTLELTKSDEKETIFSLTLPLSHTK